MQNRARKLNETSFVRNNYEFGHRLAHTHSKLTNILNTKKYTNTEKLRERLMSSF